MRFVSNSIPVNKKTLESKAFKGFLATLAVIDTSAREIKMPILYVYLNQYAQGILEFLKLTE